MNDDDMKRLISVLEEIRDDQRVQLERQTEALALQREYFAIAKGRGERAERIQARAEALQETSARLVASSRKVMAVVLPIVFVLIAYVSWLLFRR
jgi:hypothetical protein